MQQAQASFAARYVADSRTSRVSRGNAAVYAALVLLLAGLIAIGVSTYFERDLPAFELAQPMP
jgi:hypothetical protein